MTTVNDQIKSLIAKRENRVCTEGQNAFAQEFINDLCSLTQPAEKVVGEDWIKNLREEHIKDGYDGREFELFKRQVLKHLPRKEEKVVEIRWDGINTNPDCECGYMQWNSHKYCPGCGKKIKRTK